MWSKIRFISFAFLLICSVSFAQKPLVFYNENVPSKKSKKESKKDITLYYIYQESCSYCHQFSNDLESLNKEKKWLRKHVTLIAKDALNVGNTEFLKEHKISTTPTLFWVNHENNESYIYENSQDVRAFFMALLKSNHSPKYSSFFKDIYPSSYCLIDPMHESVRNHFFIAKDTLGAIEMMKHCQLQLVDHKILSENFLFNLKYTQPIIGSKEGNFLYENLIPFSQNNYFNDYKIEIDSFSKRSLRQHLIANDSINYAKAIQLEYALNFDVSDSTYLARNVEFFLRNKQPLVALKYLKPLAKKFSTTAKVHYTVSVDLYTKNKTAKEDILFQAAYAMYLAPIDEYTQWYAKLLEEFNYPQESKDLKTNP